MASVMWDRLEEIKTESMSLPEFVLKFVTYRDTLLYGWQRQKLMDLLVYGKNAHKPEEVENQMVMKL